MKVLGVIIVIVGTLLGLYVGGYLCLVCGVTGLIDTIKATPVDSFKFAINIVKIIFLRYH